MATKVKLSLAPDFKPDCHLSLKQAERIAASLCIELPDSTMLVHCSELAPQDKSIGWVRKDSKGNPIGTVLRYVDGAWS